MAEEREEPNLFQLIGPPIAEDQGTIYDYESSIGEKLQSGFGRQFDTNVFSSGVARPLNMLNEDLMAIAGAAEWVNAEKARAEITGAGLDLTVPDNGISRYELDTLKYLKKREREQQQLSARNTSMLGTVAEFTGGLAAGLTDPLNVASAFIPIVPEARYAAWVAQSSGVFGRAAVRAGAGAIEGAAGAALLEPLSYYGATSSQLDYTAADSFINVVFGGVLGSGLHVVGGATLDAVYPSRLRDFAGQAPDDVKLAALHDAVRALEEDRPVDATETFFRDMAQKYGTTDREFLNRSIDFDEANIRDARETVVMARAGEDEKPTMPSLLHMIRSMGGIKVRDANGNLTREGAEIMAVLQDVKYPGLINNKRGMAPDTVREALTEDGWFKARDNGQTDLQELYDLMDRAARGERVMPYGESKPARIKAIYSRELEEAGVKSSDTVAAASVKLSEYRAMLQRERFDEPDFEPEEIIWREPGEEDDLAGPVTDEMLSRYERADGYDDGMAEISAMADRAAMKADDLEQVAADTDFLDQQINGMKSREMWSEADEAALAAGEDTAKKLETTASVYRAAAVCMTE